MIFILGLIWIVCGIFAYGITYGYFRNKYGEVSSKYADGLLALFFGVSGILGLVMSYFLSNKIEYGLKWIDKK